MTPLLTRAQTFFMVGTYGSYLHCGHEFKWLSAHVRVAQHTPSIALLPLRYSPFVPRLSTEPNFQHLLPPLRTPHCAFPNQGAPCRYDVRLGPAEHQWADLQFAGLVFRVWDQVAGSVYTKRCFCARCSCNSGGRTAADFARVRVPDYSALLHPKFWLTGMVE